MPRVRKERPPSAVSRMAVKPFEVFGLNARIFDAEQKGVITAARAMELKAITAEIIERDLEIIRGQLAEREAEINAANLADFRAVEKAIG